MVERSNPRAPKITVKDFDDPEARAMHDVDFDLSDAGTDPQRHQHRRPDGG